MEQSSNKIRELTDMVGQKKNKWGEPHFHFGKASATVDQTLAETASAACS